MENYKSRGREFERFSTASNNYGSQSHYFCQSKKNLVNQLQEKDIEIKNLIESCDIHFKCGKKEYEKVCIVEDHIKYLTKCFEESNNEKEFLTKQLYEFRAKIDAYGEQQAKVSKEKDSLHALLETITQERKSLVAEVTCLKNFISIKDKQHKVEVDTIKKDFSNVLKDFTIVSEDNERFVASDVIQKQKIQRLEAKIQLQYRQQIMLEKQNYAIIQEKGALIIENEKFMLEIASLTNDKRFLSAKLDEYMNVKILPLTSKLFDALNEKNQAFTQINYLEDELKKFRTKMNLLNDQQTNSVNENALLVQENVLLKEQGEIYLNVLNIKAKDESRRLNVQLLIYICFTLIVVFANQKTTHNERNIDILKEKQTLLDEENKCNVHKTKVVKQSYIILPHHEVYSVKCNKFLTYVPPLRSEKCFSSSNVVYQPKSEFNQNVAIIMKENDIDDLFFKYKLIKATLACIIKQKCLELYGLISFLIEDEKSLIKMLVTIYKIQKRMWDPGGLHHYFHWDVIRISDYLNSLNLN